MLMVEGCGGLWRVIKQTLHKILLPFPDYFPYSILYILYNIMCVEGVEGVEGYNKINTKKVYMLYYKRIYKPSTNPPHPPPTKSTTFS